MRLAASPEINPAPAKASKNVIIVQIVTPIPTPENGLLDVKSSVPNPIAVPIVIHFINLSLIHI